MDHLFMADFGLFVGRFHPILVHLPIGFLLLAALLGFWPGDKLRTAIRISWGIGALAAIAAAGCGWLLAAESGGGDTLFWHRWLGVSVAALSVIGFLLSGKGGMLMKAYGLLIAGLLGLAGHQGGNLTHGEDYLFQYAPALVQKAAGFKPAASGVTDWSAVNTDSISIYQTFIRPAINESCVKCHNAGKQNGGLRMDETQFLFAGGDGGPIITPGDAMGSSWFRRVSLPRDNVKAMPPQGHPLNYATIELLAYWINEGADTLAILDPAKTPDPIKLLLARDYGLDLHPKLFVEKVIAPALAAQNISTLQMHKWEITELAPGTSSLGIKPQAGEQIDGEAVLKLAELAAEQVVYLSVENQPLTDDDLETLGHFRNLNRLRLNGVPVTVATIEKLAGLRHLESLNLYGTEVTDAVFPVLERFPALKHLYLWQSKTSQEAALAFAEKHPDTEVSIGITAESAKR